MTTPLDDLAAENPGRYRTNVALLALLGYSTLGGSLLLSLGLSAGLLVLILKCKGVILLKLLIIPLALAWAILKALFVRIDPPDGIWLRPGEAPELETEIERLRQATGAPPLTAIVITGEFNAAALSVPRLLGLLGHRHYLLLGLPLITSLDRAGFAAVVAHEFGHFGGGHGMFTGWIYRVRTSWLRVRIALDEGTGWLGAPLRNFFDWYAPYFGRYTFALARQQEYEADQTSARIVGADSAARALVATELATRRLNQAFWPSVWKEASQQAAPPSAVFSRMSDSLRAPGESDAEWLQEALRIPSSDEDTHPSLAQRLQALGCEPALPAPATDSAVQLLGTVGTQLVERFSTQWQEAASELWGTEYSRLQDHRARLDELRRQSEPVSGEDRARIACLRDELDEGEDIVAALLTASELSPDDAEVHFRLGRRALDEGDARGVGAIEAAMRLDRERMEAGLLRLHAWYLANDAAAARTEVEARLATVQQEREQALGQRRVVRKADRFLPHGLSPEKLEELRRAIKRFGKAARVRIARKQLVREDGVPHYVLTVDWKHLSLAGDDTLQKFVDAMPLEGTWTAALSKQFGGDRKAFEDAAGTPIWP